MVAQGVTVLVSTAYMDEAERCDHVAMLDRGAVVALDRPDVLQRSLAGEMLVVRTPEPRRAAQLLAKVPAVHRAMVFGDAVHVTVGSVEREWPGAHRALEAEGVQVTDVHPVEPSLEDVFLERAAADAAARNPRAS